MEPPKKLLATSKASGTIKLPGSKSITNRTLLLAALSENDTNVFGSLVSDDTGHMLEALEKLGVKLKQEIAPDKSTVLWHVTGCNGIFPNKIANLFLGNAGTAFRPLTAALALCDGHYTLTGKPRMHERPIKDLVEALRQIGANIEYIGKEDYPPLRTSPATIDVNKPIQIRGDVSSQFLSALLMALPLIGKRAEIEVVGELISKPYVEITLNLMAQFNVHVQREGWQRFIVPANSNYISPRSIFIEGDASSASYFLAAGAIAGNVAVQGVGKNSIQGDIKFADALSEMGAQIKYGDGYVSAKKPLSGKLKAINIDCNHIPDAAMTLAVLALFAGGTTTLRNIASWRVKETNRLAAMAKELRKVGATVKWGKGYIKITPPIKLISPEEGIDTYDDHRMAMCFSLVSLGGVPITINDPSCVNKTFPNYFDELKRIVT